jgi:hypothetical protein
MLRTVRDLQGYAIRATDGVIGEVTDLFFDVSRQHETEHLGYYGYPFYWGGAGLWGMGAYPGSLTTEDAVQKEMQARWRAESGCIRMTILTCAASRR